MGWSQSFSHVSDAIYEADRNARAGMRVPARIVADEVLFGQIGRDRSIEQLLNVATLPGLVGHVVGMPDMHEGYGFPVGGVAATSVTDGVISPGGIGFDINCGVRLLATNISRGDVDVEPLLHQLMRSVPAGYGHGGRLELSHADLDRILEGGAPEIVRRFELGSEEDLACIEGGGQLVGARASAVSDRAKHRGRDQLGTLGGGNHFLEIQLVQAIYDREAARTLGLELDQITVLVHTGSRGLGHQVCTDHVRAMDASLARYGITLPDRQLACVPFASPEGGAYFAAMCAAANFAFANREVLTHRVREAFREANPNAVVRVVYDVAHNIAKIEQHGGKRVCVHRKGATRAFGPDDDDVPAPYRAIGQPVLIPGSMGTASFVLVGSGASTLSFASACHGAGRAMSRTAARGQVKGGELRRELASQGIAVRCPSNAELAEEAPIAYKDVERVVDVVHRAGIARKVARLVPVGVLKG
ncbi:MAG: RNA-splicing ligase RtcB [Myxococcales bacterium 68-20]|nr:RtcB family protein [Myxococcales bacterium]OJY17052.1 MAG: RNA-splicing ligase RtcB [Myxococcales bacterium 68-20]